MRVSGAGDVSFINPNAADSAAVFNAAGTYVLRLAATDGALSTSDDVTVTVNPANSAPTVNAGADQAVTLPVAATLSGTIADDNNPQGGGVSARWEKVSGAGTVAFADPNQPNTTAAFSQAGTFVLRLTADDGDLEASDDLTVTVAGSAAPTPTPGGSNQAPVVAAGANQTVVMPNNTATRRAISSNTKTARAVRPRTRMSR